MPRLLQINVTAGWGSTGKISGEISRIAIENGWESSIAFGRYDTGSFENYYKVGNKLDLFSHVAISRLFDKHGLGSKRATEKLVEYIKEYNPDVIHLHNIHGYFLNYEVLFKYLKTLNTPIVWTMHDCWSITGHCAYFDSIGCEKWKSECYNCELLRSYPKTLFSDNSTGNYYLKMRLFSSLSNRLTLVPVSNWLNGILKESYLNKCDIMTLHNGIDTDKFHISAPKQLSPRIILGVSMDWDKRKGLADFIKLAGILPDDLHIVLVGLSKKQIASLPPNITGIERTRNVQELVELYSKATVFLNPTYEDNFPTTNLEALACGTPVVTYRTGGSPEALDESCGIVVDKGDYKGLKDAIMRIIDNQDKFSPAVCRRRVTENFRKEDRFSEYIRLYERLIKKS